MAQRHEAYPLLRSYVRSGALAARTQNALDLAQSLLAEWGELFPDDFDTLRLGEQVHKMRGALERPRVPNG